MIDPRLRLQTVTNIMTSWLQACVMLILCPCVMKTATANMTKDEGAGERYIFFFTTAA